MTEKNRIEKIIRIMEDIEKSPLSVNKYFQEMTVPFGPTQYYHYKKAIEERGIDGLIDQRNKGNHLKFTEEIKNFVKGLLNRDRSLTSEDVQKEINKEFGTSISITVINDFRRENNLILIRIKENISPVKESGASEIVMALAMETGIIDAITDSICFAVKNMRESQKFKQGASNPKDHSDLRIKGKFTKEYNKSPQVSSLRFKSIDEKITNKRFNSMRIFRLTRESLMRHTLALFSLPIVTSNGKVRSVDNPRGNALEYLCGFNYKASTLDMHIRDLKYLQISNLLIETTAKFWIDFWNSRTEFDNIFACYYIDGNTKALWSSKSCQKGKVTMLGRVMNCLEQVFIHDGQGHPLYFQTFNGHADFGENALKMIDQISEYLEKNTDLGIQFAVNRILIMDSAGNGVKTLREMTKSGYNFITMLDSNQVNDRKVKFVSEKKKYEFGDAFLTEYTIELEDSLEKGYIYATRAVQVNWENGRTCVLITSLSQSIFSTDNVVKSYFDRWPAQELSFKDMKSGVNINRAVGFTKKLIDNEKVLLKIEKLQQAIREIEKELESPLSEIKEIEKILLLKIEQERSYRERSIVVKGERKLPELDAKNLKDIQSEINSLKRKIKAIEMDDEKSFNSLKMKKSELARIIDKKKIYSVDVELDQIMTCFKISFANICCYLLEKCFNGERMTLQQIFETIFELRGKVTIDGNQRNIAIEINTKQENLMKQLESAFDCINPLGIKDIYGNKYNFKFLQFNPL
jgi:transposase